MPRPPKYCRSKEKNQPDRAYVRLGNQVLYTLPLFEVTRTLRRNLRRRHNPQSYEKSDLDNQRAPNGRWADVRA